jgi:hypothetical protein
LRVKVSIGTRQRIGLRTKLSNRAEAFLKKINSAIRGGGSKTMMSISCSRASIPSELRSVVLSRGIVPNTSPTLNREIAIRIHPLYFI